MKHLRDQAFHWFLFAVVLAVCILHDVAAVLHW
jgi:hypothetical protein